MDVYEFAMKMEQEGEKYYRDLAAGCSHKGLRSILGLLADAEVSHYEALRRMKEKEATALPESPALSGAKTLFEQMAAQGKAVVTGLGEIDLYRKALEIEQHGIDFYRHHLAKAETDAEKIAFESIIDEERRHYRILEVIIELISRPDQWLENAEWNHLDKY
jgi:rubrerythrin